MIIIAQAGAVVNINTASEKATVRDWSKYNAAVEEISETRTAKWASHKAESARVAEKMKKIDMKRGYRMAQCADTLVYNVCPDCGHIEIKRANLCRDRFCPTCNWRLSLQRYATMHKIIDAINLQHGQLHYSFVTLTVRTCPAGKLADTMTRMSAAYNKMMHRKIYYTDKSIAGFAKSVEVTYNKDTRLFHPHYHIIFAWAGADLSDDIMADWVRYAAAEGLTATAAAQNAQEIEQGGEGDTMAGAICETFKYAVKSKQLDDMPLKEFRALVKELGGKRLVSFGGIFKRAAESVRANMETVEEEEMRVCKHCGNTVLDEVIYKWSYGDGEYRIL